VDLEKAFDRDPRKEISWATRKLGVEEWLVSAVMSMYTGAKTVVRTVYGNSKGFEAKVGMHQGSALSPLLFVIVTEAISREFSTACFAVIPVLCHLFLISFSAAYLEICLLP